MTSEIDIKGAVDRILDLCTHVGLGEQRIPLDEQAKADILNQMGTIAAQGLRVLCLASKYLPNEEKAHVKSMPRDELEKDFCFLGLAGI